LDGKRFDDISRALATTSGRRGVVKATAAGALGLIGLSALRDDASARKCFNGKDCKGNDVCKNGKCVECKKDKNCSTGFVCKKNKCV
jgi:Cys-rich repeat protein